MSDQTWRSCRLAARASFTMDWKPEQPREQADLSTKPYDQWVTLQGYCQAEFHRTKDGHLIRFPGQADFLIELSATPGEYTIRGWPAPECDPATVINLRHNAIEPVLGNHLGGLFLHGSAVSITSETAETSAIAFLGHSRGGKTTLAGSFAKAGHPFLTEDVIDLVRERDDYLLKPKRSKLRLFADSARHLLGQDAQFDNEDAKQDVEAGNALPFAAAPVALRQIYLLGEDHCAPLSIRQLSMQEALQNLMKHAFLLDVEDKPRLQAHFARLADLSQDIACFALDFTRKYEELPRVMRAILDNGRDR